MIGREPQWRSWGELKYVFFAILQFPATPLLRSHSSVKPSEDWKHPSFQERIPPPDLTKPVFLTFFYFIFSISLPLRRSPPLGKRRSQQQRPQLGSPIDLLCGREDPSRWIMMATSGWPLPNKEHGREYINHVS